MGLPAWPSANSNRRGSRPHTSRVASHPMKRIARLKWMRPPREPDPPRLEAAHLARGISPHEKDRATEMDAAPDPRNAPTQSPEPLSINQGELRSLLSSLSHELCRPLVSMRAGFDLLLGD